jgi:hypothetical protein
MLLLNLRIRRRRVEPASLILVLARMGRMLVERLESIIFLGDRSRPRIELELERLLQGSCCLLLVGLRGWSGLADACRRDIRTLSNLSSHPDNVLMSRDIYV